MSSYITNALIFMQVCTIFKSYIDIDNKPTEPTKCLFFCKMIKISEEYTNTIDKILIKNKNTLINDYEIISKNLIKPSNDKHLFCNYITYNNHVNYIDIMKNVINNGNCIDIIKYEIDKKNKISKYYINYRFTQEKIKNNFINMIFNKTTDKINTISIDTTSILMETMIMQKKFNNIPYKNQKKALDSIYNHYKKTFNTKVIIYGKRGTGKTYLGKLIKYTIDSKLLVESRLYDDFNPTSIGVNIKKIALKYANEYSPIILVINEIDKIYIDVLKKKTETYDTRGYHTKDISSFHNMMDDISDINNVITIFTTEKSKKQLEENKDYLSFFRKGRIDFFINMTFNDSYIEIV
jgi:hypothetical protein